MKGVIVNRPGGTDQLKIVDIERPRPKEGELLIKVHAAAVNRTDIVTRETKGGYDTIPILGVEVSGIVIETNDDRSFKPGDRVMGLVNGGGYAEFAVMPADRAMKLPDFLSFKEAAALPEVFLTAYQTLFWIGNLQREETVLIHAEGSGVGTVAIQLARHISDANIIVTAGSKEKLDFCKKLGADILINYKEESFDKEVLKSTNNEGVDLILDFVGADYWNKNLASIKDEGRWVLIGILGGREIENIDIFEIMSKRIQITGTLLTPRSNQYKADLTKEFYEKAMKYFKDKKIKPIIDTVFPLKEIKRPIYIWRKIRI